jgi:SEC-C motif-containing protein
MPEQTDFSCPCASGASFTACCGRYLAGQDKPGRAEQLMRSRYTAYRLADGDYLYRTRHPDFRTGETAQQIAGIARQVKWQRLEIITARGAGDDRTGEVEFKAWYRQGQALAVLHERSRFVREDGQWLYTDGDINPPGRQPAGARNKPGRNDPCPCGSGKKYKRCCGLNG